MDLFTRDELRRLAQLRDDICISIYLPTSRFEADWSQNPTRFKNLLRDVDAQLEGQGYREETIDDVLSTARRQLDETSFWRSMSDGLAVFITSETTEYYRLPLSFDEIAIVGSQLHLKPLFPLLATNSRFHVLSLGERDVRLYQGTHQSVNEVKHAEIPSRIVDALFPADEAPASENGEADGASEPDEEVSDRPERDLETFFREVDDDVCNYLDQDGSPLVLIGHKDYVPTYRDVSRYPQVAGTSVIGDGSLLEDPRAIHDKSWSVVTPIFEEAEQEALEEFEQLYYQDGDLASDDFHEIVPACRFSRVDTLFVPLGQHRWGRFDPEANAVELHSSQQPGDDDLLNYAAIHAYLSGATVYVMRPQNMPGGHGIAATFRFRADVQATENG